MYVYIYYACAENNTLVWGSAHAAAFMVKVNASKSSLPRRKSNFKLGSSYYTEMVNVAFKQAHRRDVSTQRTQTQALTHPPARTHAWTPAPTHTLQSILHKDWTVDRLFNIMMILCELYAMFLSSITKKQETQRINRISIWRSLIILLFWS